MMQFIQGRAQADNPAGALRLALAAVPPTAQVLKVVLELVPQLEQWWEYSVLYREEVAGCAGACAARSRSE